jgi:asparagine synthase (glutamine-hydrolysing)
MCGIAGIVAPPGRAVDPERLRSMTDTLRHRGPDSDGYLVEGNVGLGHRRLSIIDLSREADQPLANEDGSVAVTFNGEIYNFQALRRELEERGHRFRSQGDSEVLVHLWEEEGPELVARLRGMFAFALWDRRAGRLLLARDRLGKKPLYWARSPAGFLFASELAALRDHPAVSREVDPAAVGELVVYGHVAGEGSIYQGVRRLPAGCRLVLDTTDPALEPRLERYWSFRPAPEEGLDPEEWLDRVDETLAEAVRLRMIADVPLGAFLSGGIDSSLVVSHMARLAPGRVRTFCIGFEEEGWDESAHARAVADHLGTEHRTEVVTPDAVSILPELIATYDEPFADPSAIPTWYLCRSARREVKVALSGDGGDELFFGYRRYTESAVLERLGRWLTPPGRRLARLAGRALPEGSFAGRGLDRVSRRGFELYHHALGWSPVYLSLLAPEARRALEREGGRRLEEAFTAGGRQGGGGELPFLHRCQAADLAQFLPDQILVKVDRASMRHSLEVRCPLLDQEIAELAARMPARRQVGLRDQKLLLRRLAYRHLPRELLERPKQGFAVPLDRWFRGELAPRVEEALADRRAAVWRWLDRERVERRFAHHRAGRVDAGPALWRVLVLHAWTERSGGS